jgi:gliding motility-associated-like protein
VNRQVTVYAPPVILTSNDTSICSGISTNLFATGGTSYSWLPSGSLTNANTATPTATPSVTTTYTVTVVNGNFASCTRVDSVTITVVPSPTAVASNDTTICVGTSANLVATGGTTYSWSPATNLSNPNIANPVANPPGTTTYVVTVSNGACSDTEPVTITVQSALANAGPDTSICLGGSAFLAATGGTSYSWTPTTGLSNPNIQNPVASPTVTTTYSCTVTNALGCTDVDIATVTIIPLPVAAFSVSPAIIFADSTYFFTDLSTGGIASWLWNFGDGNTSTAQSPSHFYTTAGTYHVCLITTSAGGCVDTLCNDVIVLPRDVEAPNVFTPNGDNTNDVLVFKNLEYYPNTMLQVYDRWGTLVYESANYLNDWNGKKNGNGADCVDGTYYYILSGTNLKDAITGFVQLIRGK